MPPLHVCATCKEKKEEALASITYRDIKNEMVADEARAQDITQAMTSDAKDGHPMEICNTSGVEYVVDETYELHPYTEIVAKTSQTPKALELRPVKKRSTSGEVTVLYPLPPKDGPVAMLHVLSKVGVGCEQNVVTRSLASRCQGHCDMSVRAQAPTTKAPKNKINCKLSKILEKLCRCSSQ